MQEEQLKKNYPEYYKIVEKILNSEEFQKRKNFKHHGEITVYDHSINVSLCAYKLAKKFHGDVESTAIGGLLHDFYDKPWQDHDPNEPKVPFFKKHGFVHASQAYNNTEKYFPALVNPKIKDIITKHMFPVNIKLPKYRESWFVTLADKYVSLEVLKHPTKLYKYVGLDFISRKKKKGEKNE